MAQQHTNRTAHLLQGNVIVLRSSTVFHALLTLPQPKSFRNHLRIVSVVMYVHKSCNSCPLLAWTIGQTLLIIHIFFPVSKLQLSASLYHILQQNCYNCLIFQCLNSFSFWSLPKILTSQANSHRFCYNQTLLYVIQEKMHFSRKLAFISPIGLSPVPVPEEKGRLGQPKLSCY